MTDITFNRLTTDPQPARIVTDRARYWNTPELLFRIQQDQRGKP